MDHIWFVLASLVVPGKGNQIGLKRLNGSYNERCEIIRFNVVEITKLAGAIVYFILPSYSNCSIMFMARIWGFVAIFSAHEIIKTSWLICVEYYRKYELSKGESFFVVQSKWPSCPLPSLDDCPPFSIQALGIAHCWGWWRRVEIGGWVAWILSSSLLRGSSVQNCKGRTRSWSTRNNLWCN